MTPGPWYKKLSVQLIALLTLALLPLGAVAVFQTNRVAAETDANAGLALLSLTEAAARREQILIERAVGTARLFRSIAPTFLEDPQNCASQLAPFIETNPQYSFIAVIPQSGIVECSSAGETMDFNGVESFIELMSNREPTIVVDRSGRASGESVFVISEPLELDGAFAGFVTVSIPHRSLPTYIEDDKQYQGLVELITFNRVGTVLTARGGLDATTPELPSGLELAGLFSTQSQTFRADNRRGLERRYSVVPIQGSPASALAIWEIENALSLPAKISPAVFPLLMWFASMGVAMLAMNTLVIRHLTRMRRKMDAFADDRNTHRSYTPNALFPIEIEMLEENFARMSEEILRDEAAMENAVREKGVLVKEIHHRVKNNLQLISSIINMQIRNADADETKTVLRRIQDRVLSLATIHRDLYQSQDGGRVNAGNLVTEIVEKSTELVTGEGRDLNLQMQVDPVLLYPDQAVPLSLVVSEAATNALKHVGAQSAQGGTFNVRLTQEGTTCTLVMTNSVGVKRSGDSTGLGSKLMKAFAMQLGGTIDIDDTDDRYSLTLQFNADDFQPEARDY
jgi:two-component sensor histidine kinase